MKTIAFDNRLVEMYLSLLKNMSHDGKLDLIARLSESLKSRQEETSSISSFYGSWDTEESAEDIIEDLRKARTFNRNLEVL